jgi:hypothetical protein
MFYLSIYEEGQMMTTRTPQALLIRLRFLVVVILSVIYWDADIVLPLFVVPVHTSTHNKHYVSTYLASLFTLYLLELIQRVEVFL